MGMDFLRYHGMYRCLKVADMCLRLVSIWGMGNWLHVWYGSQKGNQVLRIEHLS